MKQIGPIIDKIRKKLLEENTKKSLAISANWDKIVDPHIARRTQPVKIKQKILYVKVESPSLLQELSNFKKNVILESVQSKYPDQRIRDIKFIV